MTLYVVVDGKNLIMALLAWEEMRLQSVNKIFIRRIDFTMGKNRVVITRRFYVTWKEAINSRLTFTDVFYDWYSAYRAFRFHSSFCGHYYAALRFNPMSDSLRDNIVYRVRLKTCTWCRWYDGDLQIESILAPEPDYGLLDVNAMYERAELAFINDGGGF